MQCSCVEASVLTPLNTVLELTATTDRLILKREHKMLDYDRAQLRMDKNRDPSRTRIVSNLFTPLPHPHSSALYYSGSALIAAIGH